MAKERFTVRLRKSFDENDLMNDNNIKKGQCTYPLFVLLRTNVNVFTSYCLLIRRKPVCHYKETQVIYALLVKILITRIL